MTTTVFFLGGFLTWEMMKIECFFGHLSKFKLILKFMNQDKMIVFVFTDWFPFCLAFTLSVRFKKTVVNGLTS